MCSTNLWKTLINKWLMYLLEVQHLYMVQPNDRIWTTKNTHKIWKTKKMEAGLSQSCSYMATTSSQLLLLLFLIHVGVVVHVGAHSGHDHEGDDGDLGTKGLVLVKVYCLLIFLVSTFVGGVSPYFFRWNESFLLLGTQFAGGVFLGTSLMHFLPDANSTIQDLTPKEYPFVFMLASVGYLLTMLADVTVHLVTKRAAKGPTTVVATAEEEGRVKNTVTNGNDIPPSLVKANNLGDSILLILALCFHSVFEGIAVGVASTEADAWKNLWTILLHKIFAAIAMGIALLRMLPKRPFITTASYSFAFAISSPIGVGIGIGINATTQGVVADWIFVISMGIATGVFVYVAINHLIAKGYKPQGECYFNTPFFKFLAVTLGIGVIAVVMIWD